MGIDGCILPCNYIPTKFWNISINPVYLTVPPSIQLLPGGDNYSDPYQYSSVMPILEFNLNKIIDYVLSLFFALHVREITIHIAACIRSSFLLLLQSSVLFYQYTEVCLSSCLLTNIWIFASLGLLWIILWNFYRSLFVANCFHFLLINNHWYNFKS